MGLGEGAGGWEQTDRTGGGMLEERLVAEEEGSVAKETEGTWGKDRAGQGWSTGGRLEGRRWPGSERWMQRTRRVHTFKRIYFPSQPGRQP